MKESNALAPYRTAAIVPKIEDPAEKAKETCGIIRVGRPHECSPPGIFKRFLYLITFRPIHESSLFRCKCGTVWRFENDYGNLKWRERHLSDWVRAYVDK